MPLWNCETCGQEFYRESQGDRKYKYCGQKCYHAWRKANKVTTGQFRKGHKTWNKGVKGTHFGPVTEFKKGNSNRLQYEVGAVTVRKPKKDSPRQWIKVAEPNQWIEYAKFVWLQAGGTLPKGFVLHHIDGDAMNDVLSNLACVSRATHMNTHRHEFEDNRKAAAAKANSKICRRENERRC